MDCEMYYWEDKSTPGTNTPEHQGVIVYSIDNTLLVRCVISLEVIRLLIMIGLCWRLINPQRKNFVSDIKEYLCYEVRNDFDKHRHPILIRISYLNFKPFWHCRPSLLVWLSNCCFTANQTPGCRVAHIHQINWMSKAKGEILVWQCFCRARVPHHH